MSNLIKYKSVAIEQFKADKPLLVKHIEFEDAIKTPQINILHREEKKLCEAIILKALQDFNLLLDAQLSVEQIKFIASAIITEYWYLRIDEVPLILKRGILGDFGRIYGKPNAATILQWFAEYDKERTQYFEYQNELQSMQYRDFRYTTNDLVKMEERINKLKNK